MTKTTNMISNAGNAVANQFEITTNRGTFFQSYDSVIAFIPRKLSKHYQFGTRIQLDRKFWDYSKTTGKYRNQFLGEGIAATRKKIKSGEYKLTDLNKSY